MPVIILLLFTLNVFGQNTCGSQEAQDLCFKQLCSVKKHKPIPVHVEELDKTLSSFPYALPKKFDDDLEQIVKLSDAVKGRAAKALSKDHISAIADHLIKAPEDGSTLLERMFSGELQCVNKDVPCELLSSNFVPYSHEMKEAFKTYWDFSFVFRSMDLEEQKRHLIRLNNEFDGDEAEEVKIKNLSQTEIIDYFSKSSLIRTYKASASEKLKTIKSDLEGLLRLKIEDLMKIDFRAPRFRKKVQKNCQLASYLKSQLSRPELQKDFEKLRKETINNFKSRFLAKLSTQTAKDLSQQLSEDIFHLQEIEFNTSLGEPSLGFFAGESVIADGPVEVLQDLLLVKSNESYGCRMSGLAPTDKYEWTDSKIMLSRFTILNGHGDILPHEVGHWFSHQLAKKNVSEHSREKILEVRKCVQDFYPKEVEAKLWYVEGDKKRSEEDFADWIQSIVGKEQGLWCDMKLVMEMFTGVTNKDFYIPEESDTHSNFLFRELVVRLNRGERIPKICEDLMKSYPDYVPRKCELRIEK